MPANPFEDPDERYLVLRNPRGQRSLWPARLPAPTGWLVEFPADSRARARAHVERVWPDVRPRTPSATASETAETLPVLFERSAAEHRELPAVESESTASTYGELAGRVNRLARRLIAAGLGPGDLVGISVPRGTDQVVAALAVTTAGAGYVPLDPGYPTALLRHMATDSGLRTLLHTGPPPVDVTGPHTLDLASPDPVSRPAGPVADEERRRPLCAEDTAYVIYTSGSTGTPKGVVIPHAGMAALAAAQRHWIAPGPGDRVLQWASFNFDAGFWDLTLALLSGATLVLTDDRAVLPGEELRRTLIDRRITHAVLPPVALTATDPEGVLPGGVVLSTGDSCTPALVARWAPGRRMFNGYGPTEMTVGVTMAGPVRPGEPVSIGVPWPGNEVRVLDVDLRSCQPGEEGELYLVGEGEALGYLNRPALTAERFVADPYGAPGSRMYRSGDLGYVDKDGALYFTGRADRQVKLRGFRVELGEVETALESCDGVRLGAVVVIGEVDSARLAAFVVPGADPADDFGEELRRRLAERLPAHMVPARVEVVASLPMTSNGKIDRRALERRFAGSAAPPSPPAAESGGPSAAPAPGGPARAFDRSDPVAALCELAARVLQVPTVAPDDDFFDRGGHSVLAVRLAKAVRDDWGVDLSVRTIFERPTMAELGGLLTAD
ncbi:amino acid adenylation domain-containing protein [Streptomyces sp. OF3]|uniref:Amino acid adenylation domain-containing protein n=1 Tax=Streptomyces alkaliterrae TaxID=2213162 RepID=A0A7W3ZLP7_9ACTN|nr:amino acid adenylation domain-containing protein [Streptomyces alkaliterrae]MBB1252641.1 amino acid adenylation domain-containing protein [Streptomyces alkaliterrae]